MRFLAIVAFLFQFISSDPNLVWTYEEHPVLSWDDFRGVPPDGSNRAASVNSGLSYSFKNTYENGILKDLDIQVKSGFYPELSWKMDLKESSKDLLAHEQLHWDITNLFALKLRAAYKKYRPVKNIKKEVAFIFNKFEKDRAAMQAQYDRDTKHGLDKEAQLKWLLLVNAEMLKVDL